MDTDEGGRRAGNPEDDHKDMLPAYDNVGGPPKYVEMGMEAGTPVHVDLVGVVEREQTTVSERDTPRQSVDVPSTDQSHHSSTHSQANLRQPEPDITLVPDPPAIHHPV
jgi:hypothetical protein